MEERSSQVTEPITDQEELRQLAEAGDVTRFLSLAGKVHPSDLSDIMASLEEDVQLRLDGVVRPELHLEASRVR